MPTVRGSVNEAFEAAVAAMRSLRLRPELVWQETPAPSRIAPHALAITADVVVDDDELATGRLVLLHDPAGHEAWQGTFRLVAYVRAEVEAEMVADPLLGSVGWSWLTESLAGRDAAATAISGTVTRVSSEGFGGMADDPTHTELEIRASWTPRSTLSTQPTLSTPADLAASGLPQQRSHDAVDPIDVIPHALAWGDLLAVVAGLPAVPAGVASLATNRRGRP